MNPLGKKMLMAFVLAVALALSLAGATYYFPSGQSPQSSSNPQTTAIPAPLPSTAPSTGSAIQPAMPAPTAPPVSLATTNESTYLIPILSIVAAIIIVIVAVWLLFSERDLKMEHTKN